MSGGGNDRAQREAQKAEDERKAQIQQTTAMVNSIYDNPNREQSIQDFIGATRDGWTKDLERQQADHMRKEKFALARSGQIGGSLQVDRAQDSGERFTDAMLDIERSSQQHGQRIRDEDQQQRMSLVGLVNSGLDATTASSQAQSRMRTDLQAERPMQMAGDLSNAFGSFADFQQRSREDAARRKADSDYGVQWQSAFRPQGRD